MCKFMKSNLIRIFPALAAAAVVLALAPSARAVPELELISGGQTVTIYQGQSNDLSSTPDVVTYFGSVGNFSINVTTGEEAGTAADPILDVNSIDIASAGAGGSLTILFSDTGFGPSAGGADASIGGTLAPGGSLTYSTYADSTDTLFGTDTPLTSQVFTTTPFSGSSYAQLTESGPYALTLDLNLTEGGGATTSFDASFAVPDGASTVALLGLVLVGIEALRRKFATA
jgi:hypothetical protein